jgi:tetratricopeptide (TPR) repeat protein
MKSRLKSFLLALLPFILLTSGCGFVNRIRAKNELNEGARAYKSGKFAVAETHFRRAVEINPDDKNAPVFVARSIHAQFRQGVDTKENMDKARQAIAAYQKVLERDPANDDAYNAVAFLYGALKDDKKQLDWIMARASMDSVSREKRSEAFTVLASKEWDCAFQITELPENKQTVMKEGKALIQFKKPKEQKEFDRARQCSSKGMEFVEKAIALNPQNDSAWSYKTNLLREMAKLAEMEGKADQKSQFEKQANVAQEKTTELGKINQEKREAEEKKLAEQQTS